MKKSNTKQDRKDEQAAAKARVADALHELLNNPTTPDDLYEAVAEFVCERSTKIQNVLHSRPVLIEVLDSYQLENLIGQRMERKVSHA